MDPKIIMVCLTSNFKFLCIKCNKKMPFTEKHWKGTFLPKKPLAPDLEDTAYVYALCQDCFEEIKDPKTGFPDYKWQDIFQDEIFEIVTMQNNPRLDVKDSGLSDPEISTLKRFLLTGRVK